jgi:membrane dipeptidase
VDRAQRLAQTLLIADGHIDLPFRLAQVAAADRDRAIDCVVHSAGAGDFDYPRARAGGLDAAFMAIYVPSSYQQTGGARDFANVLIDLVDALIERFPDKFGPAHCAADVEANFASGRISLPMGIENGAAIESSLENLEFFYRRGVRYVTLTHAVDNLICDSSYSQRRRWGGLSAFGRAVVAEMNRLGMMVDVSHVSDEAFFQIAEASRAPIIASHSSARHFTPGFERNLSNDMMAQIAATAGVVLITFGSSFLSNQCREYFARRRAAAANYAHLHELSSDSPELRAWTAHYEQQNPPIRADVSQVADHIEQAICVAGIDHVGIGSDFEGIGDSQPLGLGDVSQYPNLIRELLARGHSEDELARLLSGNLLRVWRHVEQLADHR